MNYRQQPIIAINQIPIANRPESCETLMHFGTEVGITTASHPSFLGFEQLLQIGIRPMTGRATGAARWTPPRARLCTWVVSSARFTSRATWRSGAGCVAGRCCRPALNTTIGATDA
jgi:hypothetical protein